VFFSRNRSRVKILHWDGDGYWLHYKRLETSTFRVATKEDGAEELTGVDLSRLLYGMDFKRIKLSKRVEQSLSEPEHLW
jgi:transposase